MVLLAIFVCYLVGAIPFGVIVGRARGIDISKVGSGNIGATNVGRVLGWRWGILVFVLDFLKGAVPVFLVAYWQGSVNEIALAGGLAAVLGHVFPIYLRFRGGKGVAIAAGVLSVLLPMPTLAALLAFAATVIASRTISLSSIVAAFGLVLTQLSLQPNLANPATALSIVAAALIVARHRSNIARLRAGDEPIVPALRRSNAIAPGLHVLAMGLWCGAAWFFILGVAGRVFTSFDAEVADPQTFITVTGDAHAFGSRLAAVAITPMFPVYFAVQAVCGLLAVGTAVGWLAWSSRRCDRIRAWILVTSLMLVAIGWPISRHVSHLRVDRYAAEPSVREPAQAAFSKWHQVSVIINLGVLVGTAAALTLAAYPPREQPAEVNH